MHTKVSPKTLEGDLARPSGKKRPREARRSGSGKGSTTQATGFAHQKPLPVRMKANKRMLQTQRAALFAELGCEVETILIPRIQSDHGEHLCFFNTNDGDNADDGDDNDDDLDDNDDNNDDKDDDGDHDDDDDVRWCEGVAGEDMCL